MNTKLAQDALKVMHLPMNQMPSTGIKVRSHLLKQMLEENRLMKCLTLIKMRMISFSIIGHQSLLPPIRHSKVNKVFGK